ncbi:MAG: hypothetical protein EXS35_07000 [Pedosphaera sp.]|nr:hypothetical protein [Pedosphaera sp.]
MKSKLLFPRVLALTLCFACAVARAGDKPAATPAELAFARLKNLAGEWHGRVGDRAQGPEATVVYRLTAGGSTVMETLFPGTPHEMVTMYLLEGGKLVLTHYCAAGNQPKMALTKKSTPDALDFNFIGGANISSRRDGHMHAARLRFTGKDALEAEWDYFKDGKKADTKKFFLTRKS